MQVEVPRGQREHHRLATMAVTNKRLAQSNKSPHRANATKKRNPARTAKRHKLRRPVNATFSRKEGN
jgi:hypothetical protein